MKKRNFLSKAWDKIESFAIILIIWTIIAAFLPIKDYLGATLFSILSWIITIGIFGYLGYSMKKEGSEKWVGKYGALLGTISGIIGGIIGLIMVYFMPETLTEVVQAAIDKGADSNTIMMFIKIGAWVSLIFGTLFSAAIGAFVSWLGSLTTKAPRKK